jgi:hypothetical protein
MSCSSCSRAGVRQDHGELVAAEPGRVVADAEHPPETLAEVAQRGIAGGVGPRCR